MRQSLFSFLLLISGFLFAGSFSAQASVSAAASGHLSKDASGPVYSETRAGGENVTMYGFRLVSMDEAPRGWTKFNASTPETVELIVNTDEEVYSGAYVDKEMDGNGIAYIQRIRNSRPLDLAQIDPVTGEITTIGSHTSLGYAFADMSYDYTTDRMYALRRKQVDSKDVTDLILVNLENGTCTVATTIKKGLVGIAIDMSGQIWSIDTEGNLLMVKKETGTFSLVGSTGATLNNSYQDLEFNHATNTLYWTNISNESRILYTVNTSTAAVTNCGVIGAGTQFVALTIPFTRALNVPKAVTDFTVTPGATGALTAALAWTCPTQNFDGTSATVTSVKIYRNNTLLTTLPTSGGAMTWSDETISAAGGYSYKVVAVSAAGDGFPLSAMAHIGPDTPLAPKNVKLVNGAGIKGLVTWEHPDGANNGWVNTSELTYTVTRMQGNTEQASFTDIKALTYTDESITEPALYRYKVTVNTPSGPGESTLSGELFLHNPYTTNYTMGFEDEEEHQYWRIFNLNNDMFTWNRSMSAPLSHSGDFHMRIGLTFGTNNDWFFSPLIKLESETTYKVQFWAKSDSRTEKLALSIASQQSVDAVIEEIWRNEEITTAWTLFEVVLEGYEEGYYSFGFYSFTTKPSYLRFDDFSVTEQEVVDMSAIKLYGPKTAREDKTFTYKAQVKNEGKSLISEYTVNLLDKNDNVLASVDMEGELAAGDMAVVDIPYTPSTSGNIEIRAQVVVEDDNTIENNISAAYAVDVYTKEAPFAETIGVNTAFATHEMPFDFTSAYSFAQSLYYDFEIGVPGRIDSVKYFCRFSTAGINVAHPVKIWMANTTLNALDSWLPEEEFVLVYDGTVTPPLGNEKSFTIKLNTPFLYAGENLVIITQRQEAKIYGNISDSYYYTATDEYPNRTRSYSGNTPFNWSSTGKSTGRHPNIQLFMEIDGGSVSGVITDGENPVEGVNIEVEGKGFYTKTNEQGEYAFGFMPLGTHQLKASKMAYDDNAKSAVVTLDNNTEVDFELALTPLYSVKGKVSRSDNNAALANANIKLSGYSEFSAVTGANGEYEIKEVYSGHTYDIIVSMDGFASYTTTLLVDKNITGNDYQLTELAYPVNNVEAMVNDNQEVELKWYKPTSMFPKEFRYDSDKVNGRHGVNNATDNTVIGSVHRWNSRISEVSWITSDFEGTPAETVNVFILDLDKNGKPTSTVLYSAMNVKNDDGEWMSHTLPSPVEAPNGFMVGLSYAGNIAIGMSSPTDEYPFAENTHFIAQDYTSGSFTAFENVSTGALRYNAMIRAKGYQYGSQMAEGNRALTEYVIYRFAEGTAEASWTELTSVTDTTYVDKTWSSVECDIYKYAVKAKYTNTLASAQLSEALEACFTVTFNIVDEESQPIENATITFDGNTLSGYLAEDVAPGEYDYSVEKEGFETKNGTIRVGRADVEENVTLIIKTGITEDNELSGLKIYPNPFNDQITIDDVSQVKRIRIIDITGQLVKDIPASGNVVSTTDLSEGIYLFIIESHTGKQVVHRLIKR